MLFRVKEFSTVIRRIVYLSLYKFDRLISRDTEIIVLCYHSLSHDNWRFSVSKRNFVKQINILLGLGYKFISIEMLEKYLIKKKSLPNKSILLTFDDGYEDILEITDIVKNYDIKPLVFLLSQAKVNREELENNKKLLNLKQIKKLRKLGWGIGVHSATHPKLTTINSIELDKEVVSSKLYLEHKLGSKIKYFAYPKGVYNPEVINKVRNSGYHLAFSCDDEFITDKTNAYVIPRVGVDGTHTIKEFPAIFSPSVIQFRKVVKKFIGVTRFTKFSFKKGAAYAA